MEFEGNRGVGSPSAPSLPPWLSGVAGTVNLSGKLGASRSSLAAKKQLVGGGDSKLSSS
jgi:hypothetical protein